MIQGQASEQIATSRSSPPSRVRARLCVPGRDPELPPRNTLLSPDAAEQQRCKRDRGGHRPNEILVRGSLVCYLQKGTRLVSPVTRAVPSWLAPRHTLCSDCFPTGKRTCLTFLLFIIIIPFWVKSEIRRFDPESANHPPCHDAVLQEFNEGPTARCTYFAESSRMLMVRLRHTQRDSPVLGQSGISDKFALLPASFLCQPPPPLSSKKKEIPFVWRNNTNVWLPTQQFLPF